jgi:hypothetical protein
MFIYKSITKNCLKVYGSRIVNIVTKKSTGKDVSFYLYSDHLIIIFLKSMKQMLSSYKTLFTCMILFFL